MAEENLDEKILPTSFDARQLLETWNNVYKGSIPDKMFEIGLKHKLVLSMQRMIYDIEPRHLYRVISAKGHLPYYNSSKNLEYARTFGFEKQGLKLDEITKEILSEALVSNQYAAMDHIYWVFGDLRGEALYLLDNKHISMQTGESLDTILKMLNNTSSNILTLERDILTDQRAMPLIENYVGKTFDFSQPAIDRSWRNNPHWENFNLHFKEQYESVNMAIDAIEQKRLLNYNSLNELIHRLDRYASR